MAEPMRVDTMGVRHCQPGLAALSTALDEARRRLDHHLDPEGACWGADELGSAFAASYLPAEADVRAALSRLRDVLAAVGDALLSVADNADAAEGRTRHRFS
jgi:hypothetical protein